MLENCLPSVCVTPATCPLGASIGATRDAGSGVNVCFRRLSGSQISGRPLPLLTKAEIGHTFLLRQREHPAALEVFR